MNTENDVRAADDNDDARAAASGDVDAFSRLYAGHLTRITRVARWILGSDDVGDAVQDAFFRAWQKLDTYRGDAAFGTWLDRLASNVFLRERERRARRAGRTLPLDGSTLDSQARTDRPDVRVDLERAVERLPERARLVFVLHDVQGLDHREVADRLGITTPTSRSQLHRARMILREHLTENET